MKGERPIEEEEFIKNISGIVYAGMDTGCSSSLIRCADDDHFDVAGADTVRSSFFYNDLDRITDRIMYSASDRPSRRS